MSLDVENPETCRLADELARLTSETKTGANAWSASSTGGTWKSASSPSPHR